jgi:thermostable 8-oxoguanine DNA glycosylase
LDTHILNYLGEQDGEKIPRSTPTGNQYANLEERFLFYADFYGVDPAAFDLAIWRASRESHPLNWRNYMEDFK